MWTRREVKERGKAAFKRNYWKTVLVSFVILFLGGGVGFGVSTQSNHFENRKNTDIQQQNEAFLEAADAISDVVEDGVDQRGHQTADIAVFTAFSIVILIFVCVVFALALAFSIFLVNPLIVGAQRFMLKNLSEKASIAELSFSFDHSYLNIVKTMFFRELHIFLWTLLLIIPGIYKKYQYYMVEYILAEYPDMPYREVLARSKKIMDGQKWNTFVLDLSFILWHMLSLVTCGLSEYLFVVPYQYMTQAALYRTLTGTPGNDGNMGYAEYPGNNMCYPENNSYMGNNAGYPGNSNYMGNNAGYPGNSNCMGNNAGYTGNMPETAGQIPESEDKGSTEGVERV